MATCWAPTLLWSESVSIDQMTYDSQYGHSILQALIESFDQILIPPSISPSTRARLMIDKKCGWINFKDKVNSFFLNKKLSFFFILGRKMEKTVDHFI